MTESIDAKLIEEVKAFMDDCAKNGDLTAQTVMNGPEVCKLLSKFLSKYNDISLLPRARLPAIFDAAFHEKVLNLRNLENE